MLLRLDFLFFDSIVQFEMDGRLELTVFLVSTILLANILLANTIILAKMNKRVFDNRYSYLMSCLPKLQW